MWWKNKLFVLLALPQIFAKVPDVDKLETIEGVQKVHSNMYYCTSDLSLSIVNKFIIEDGYRVLEYEKTNARNYHLFNEELNKHMYIKITDTVFKIYF